MLKYVTHSLTHSIIVIVTFVAIAIVYRQEHERMKGRYETQIAELQQLHLSAPSTSKATTMVSKSTVATSSSASGSAGNTNLSSKTLTLAQTRIRYRPCHRVFIIIIYC